MIENWPNELPLTNSIKSPLLSLFFINFFLKSLIDSTANGNKKMCINLNSPIIKKYMENLLKTNKEELLISNYTDKYICIYSNEYYELENNNGILKNNIFFNKYWLYLAFIIPFYSYDQNYFKN